LGVLLAGLVAARAADRPAARRLVGAVVVLGCAVSVVAATGAMRHGSLDSEEEQGELSALPAPVRAPAPTTPSPILMGARVAHDIDARSPRRGQVLTDSATTFTVLLNARDQGDYVIPADRDDERIVADPTRFGVRYVLVGQPSTAYDSVAAAWPGMFAHGGGIAHLLDEWGSSADPKTHFRLYELNAWRRR
jgi:hypothetical protein